MIAVTTKMQAKIKMLSGLWLFLEDWDVGILYRSTKFELDRFTNNRDVLSDRNQWTDTETGTQTESDTLPKKDFGSSKKLNRQTKIWFKGSTILNRGRNNNISHLSMVCAGLLLLCHQSGHHGFRRLQIVNQGQYVRLPTRACRTGYWGMRDLIDLTRWAISLIAAEKWTVKVPSLYCPYAVPIDCQQVNADR